MKKCYVNFQKEMQVVIEVEQQSWGDGVVANNDKESRVIAVGARFLFKYNEMLARLS